MMRGLVGIIVLLAVAAPARAELQGFRSVLAQGQGTTATAADLSANLVTGAVPAEFVNQQELYSGLSTAYPTLTEADLDRFFKDSDVGAMPGGAGPDGVAAARRDDRPRPAVPHPPHHRRDTRRRHVRLGLRAGAGPALPDGRPAPHRARLAVGARRSERRRGGRGRADPAGLQHRGADRTGRVGLRAPRCRGPAARGRHRRVRRRHQRVDRRGARRP